jgi:hypothetical protein
MNQRTIEAKHRLKLERLKLRVTPRNVFGMLWKTVESMHQGHIFSHHHQQVDNHWISNM